VPSLNWSPHMISNLQQLPTLLASMFLVVLSGLAGIYGGTWQHVALALVGGGLGFVLFQATFGFAGSFRAALETRDFSGFRVQAVSLAICSIVFFPLIANGELFGSPINGFVTPIGISFIFGAILFGIGMQIGGGCASGTLFSLGGGNVRLLGTLAFFLVGSGFGAAHLGFWWSLPAFQTATTQDLIGWPFALALHLVIFAAAYELLPGKQASEWQPMSYAMFFQKWPLLLGSIGLASMNVLTIILAGRPWGETAGFTLWVSKMAVLVGMEPEHWPYWASNSAPLKASVFADITSVMDFGIVAGATLAAGVSGRFKLRNDGPLPAWAGACVGGFLMGYGARLSDGCNIGAYYSALASGSLSGWVWIAAAFLGSALGLRLRPLFRLV
jgi:uncharacterized protein